MKTILPLALFAAFFAMPSYAACSYPKAPDNVPDGNSATLEQMLASQKAVKAFDAAITAYQSCLETENNEAIAANPSLSEEQRRERMNILAQRQNAAVDDAQSWADKINAQIRVWRARNSRLSNSDNAAASSAVTDMQKVAERERAKTAEILATVREEQRKADEARALAEALETARKDRLAAEAALENSRKKRAAAEGEQQLALGSADEIRRRSQLGKRVALVIGNSTYPDQPLSNPSNDSADLAKALRSRGFKVIEKTNASLFEMRRAAREFAEQLVSSDAALFYFAGHGVEVDGRNYLIPIGADIAQEFEVADQAYDAGQITQMMESIPSASGQRVNILIVDACRNNPLTRSWRSASRGLAKMDAPTGTIIAFSTAPGRVAADGKGRNSPFTKHLLSAIQKPGQPIEQVFKSVRRAVLEETNGAQTPWENSSLVGDFYFTSSP
jgi:hypothetical protein